MRRLLIHTGAWRRELYLLGLFLSVLAVGTAVILNPADAFIGPGLAFDQLGLRLAVGLGFGPTAVVAPLYPFYLSLFYGWIGYSHQAVLLSQVLLLAGLTSTVALLVRYLGLSPRYAWLAGALVGFFPQALALVRHFTPTLLVAFLWAAAIHLWIRNRPHPSWIEAALSGLIFGVVLLGRFGLWIPIAVLLASRGSFPAPRWFFQTPGPARSDGPPRVRKGGRRAFVRASLAGLVVLGTVTPWIVRNSQLHGELVFVDSTWASRWRAATVPGEHTIDYIIPGRTTRHPDHMPVLQNRLDLGDVVGFASAEPVKLLRIWARRAGSLIGFSGWNDAATLDRFPYEGPAYQLLQALVYGLLMSLLLSWAVLLRSQGKAERLLARTLCALALLGIVTGGVGDVRIYSLPLLVPLAMRGLWGLLVQLRVRLRAREGDPPAVLGAYPSLRPWPLGVEPASPLRWGVFVALVIGVWIHGLSGLLTPGGPLP